MVKKCKLCNLRISEDDIRWMEEWMKTYGNPKVDEEALVKAIFGKEAVRVSEEEFRRLYGKEGNR